MSQPSPSPGSATATRLSVTSASFRDGTPMPPRLATPAAGGQNVSPALAWGGAPGGTKSFAIECVDLAPVANHWVHWLVIDIPGDVATINEGASGSGMPAGAKELPNSAGRTGWGGPQPPTGSGVHEYRFVVYALDVSDIAVKESASLTDVYRALDGHVLATGSLTGTFER